MAESKKFSVRTDGGGQNVFVTDVFLLSVPEEVRPKALSINDDGRVVLTTMSGGGGTTDTGSLLANASVNSNTLTFTRGDSTTFNLTVNTGSGGGSINTGSLLTTASVSLNTITFTKGDASTFNILVNTGSDQFTGTVTSVGGTGTVNGITLSGTVTTSGNLTLGGSVSINNSNWSGLDLSVANGGTGASTFTSNALLTGNGTSAIQAESNLTFNGSTLAVTGNVTATSFTGSLLGTATNATTSSTIIITDAPTAPINFYPVFSQGTTGNQSLQVDSSTFTYYPQSNTLTVANLNGTASVATNIAVTDAGGDTSTYVLLAGSQTGNQGAKTDGGLIYNASTNALTATSFLGTATSATSANSATSASYADNAANATTSLTSSTIDVTLVSENFTYYPTFIYKGDGEGGENGRTLYYDDSTFSYNHLTDTLTVTSSYALTASYLEGGGGGGSTDTGSLLTTASVSLNTITFTKGDASTFNITVNTGSDTTYTAGSGLSLGGTTFAFDGSTATLPSRTYKPVGASQTANTSTDTLSAGFLYPLDATGGTITITLRASTPGYEFDFFVTNLDNQIDFSPAGGITVISENGLKANSTGSAISAKALNSTTWALVGSLKV